MDGNPLIHIPAGYIKNIYSKTLTWGFEAKPGPGTNGRRFALPQGRVLGGSNSINGLNYVRGQSVDYDSWLLPAMQDPFSLLHSSRSPPSKNANLE
jgi:choline dehydrogenase